MLLHRQRAQKYLQTFDFESLFIEELGWDTVDLVTLPFEVDGESFEVMSIAWHLDDRPLRNQNEINPDVLGYIFEKYINQKQMGAYYTKEDITEYISKNTILPFLFDAAKKRCPAAFRSHPLTPASHALRSTSKGGEEEPENSHAPLSRSGRGAGGEGKPRYEYFRYGVDIMEEATEICKLRLFLKLVAQMEPQPKKDNFGLEPLPDIDFNIRAGNTLVGFAGLAEVRKAISQEEVKSKKTKGKGRDVEADQFKLDLQDDASRINEKAELADPAFQRFRQMQTEFGMDAGDFRTAKQELRRRLAELNDELNHYLAREYGVDVNKPAAFEKWRDSHQPFHWFVEFYSIIDRGGFDVIIGNPPYVEYSKVKKIYSIRNYKTESCGNLYAYSLERAAAILRHRGKLGFIIPVASVCTDGYTSLQRVLREKGGIAISNFNDRPSKLFDGLEHIRLTIILWRKHNEAREICTTKYNKWQAIGKNSLFDCLTCSACPDQFIIDGSIPKVHSPIEQGIFSKLVRQRKTIEYFLRQNGSHKIYYTRKLSGFVQILNFIPKIYDSAGESRHPSELKDVEFDTKTVRDVYLALLNSNLFYWFLTIYSDCRNLNKRELMISKNKFRTSLGRFSRFAPIHGA